METAEKLPPSSTANQTDTIEKAQNVSRTFTKAFTLFGICHRLYNSGGKLSGSDIDSLGEYRIKICTLNHSLAVTDASIEEFMQFYRQNFPAATVMPKMHFVEEHMIPWLRKYGVGLGLMGEQGAESIHAKINTVKRAYSNMRDKVERLHSILREHHRQTCPVLANLKPEVKTKKEHRIKGH